MIDFELDIAAPATTIFRLFTEPRGLEFVELIRRNASAFSGAAFSDVRRLVDGDRAVCLYQFELGGTRVPMAKAFEVRDAHIARVDLYFDPAALRPQSPSGQA